MFSFAFTSSYIFSHLPKQQALAKNISVSLASALPDRLSVATIQGMSIEKILGPGGTIAQRLGNYEARPQQFEMASAVAQAIADRRHLMVEAGTGVGKSFAYLIPALLASLANRDCRVVVSTHTISLQEQLITKDLPFLQSVLPSRFKAVLVKGRSNYLSLRRLRIARQKQISLLSDSGALQQLREIGQWTRQTDDGSRSDLSFKPLPAVWDLVESDSGNCLGRKCTNYSECFYFKARREMHDAHLLVVNHALFFSDLALRRTGARLLPKYNVAILDEAHTLEDVAADQLGLQLSRGGVEYLLSRLYSRRYERGLLTAYGTPDSLRVVEETRNAAERFFHDILEWRSGQGRQNSGPFTAPGESLRVRQPYPVIDSLSEELKKLGSCLEGLADKRDSPEEKIELTAMAARSELMALGFRQWLEQSLDGQVYWLETSGEPVKRLTLACAPIDVGPALRENLYSQIPTVVLTSATLSAGGKKGFDLFQHRLGLADCATLQLGSPFNYQEQAQLHLFRNMPDPAADNAAFEEACLGKIREFVEQTRGRAFVLFTSNHHMHRAAVRLGDWCTENGFTLLCQSDGLPRHKLLEQFRTARNPILLGVDSFWQGVDVQGDALSNVIITRLPFASPGRPLIEARGEAIEGAGGNAFFEYSVPQAVIKLKQGFGRLVRTRTDKGLVVILDPRILTKRYGKTFLAALPNCRRFVDGVAEPG